LLVLYGYPYKLFMNVGTVKEILLVTRKSMLHKENRPLSSGRFFTCRKPEMARTRQCEAILPPA
jgi:hypothetical protein